MSRAVGRSGSLFLGTVRSGVPVERRTMSPNTTCPGAAAQTDRERYVCVCCGHRGAHPVWRTQIWCTERGPRSRVVPRVGRPAVRGRRRRSEGTRRAREIHAHMEKAHTGDLRVRCRRHLRSATVSGVVSWLSAADRTGWAKKSHGTQNYQNTHGIRTESKNTQGTRNYNQHGPTQIKSH